MPDPGDEIAPCLAAARRGDEAAARALVERVHPLVMRIVRAHRPRALPEADLAQEVYLKMFAALGSYQARDGAPFEHWLSRLAVRTCLDALRAERRRPAMAQLSAEAQAWLESLQTDAAASPEQALGARELVDVLLGQLPPADRLLLTLLDLEERSVAEVARTTGWSPVLVRVRAFRARRRLRLVAARKPTR